MMTLIPVALMLASASSKPEVHALIVANNSSLRPELESLQFADDDGARYFELLGLIADRVTLLSVLDASTQSLHPEAAAVARAPSRAELDAALGATFSALERARAAGRRTIFYFVYVGHGSLDDRGEGVVHLADGYFSRGDLYRRVLKRSPATVNHVIVDACNAYLLVAQRGEDSSALDRALTQFLDEESLVSYPNTGFLLATSKAANVHEWSQFSAGIFSHEVRSALIGAADVGGDGSVTYAEVQAFVSAANAAVKHPSARLEVFGQPPRVHRREPLFDRSWVRSAPILRVPASMAGRYWLEDNRGIRYADFNSAQDSSISLVLVPSEGYYLHSDTAAVAVPSELAHDLDASRLSLRPSALNARGAEERSFRRHLFSVPFGRAYFEGFRASMREAPSQLVAQSPTEWTTREWIAASAIGGAAASLATAIGFGLSYNGLKDDFSGAIGSRAELEDLQGRADAHRTIANTAFVTAAALAAAGVLLFLWPDEASNGGAP